MNIEEAAARIAELEAALSAATARAEAALRTIRETHKRAVRHADCDREYCHICDGGLFQCADCGAIEADAELRVCTAEKAAREAAEAEAARLREAFREQRLKPGVRAVITAVHKRATEMGDQKCKAWLNSLGFELGLQLSRDRMDLSEAVEGSFTRAALGGDHVVEARDIIGYCTDCENQTRVHNGRCGCGSGRVITLPAGWTLAPPGSRVVPEGGVDAGWQPIETAPFTFDDGRRWLTWCLLWVPDQYGGLAIVGGMNADEWLWRDDERACAGFQTAPTHWRHLPEPPALRALAEAKP